MVTTRNYDTQFQRSGSSNKDKKNKCCFIFRKMTLKFYQYACMDEFRILNVLIYRFEEIKNN